MDKGAWWASVHGVNKLLDTTEHICTYAHIDITKWLLQEVYLISTTRRNYKHVFPL